MIGEKIRRRRLVLNAYDLNCPICYTSEFNQYSVESNARKDRRHCSLSHLVIYFIHHNMHLELAKEINEFLEKAKGYKHRRNEYIYNLYRLHRQAIKLVKLSEIREYYNRQKTHDTLVS